MGFYVERDLMEAVEATYADEWEIHREALVWLDHTEAEGLIGGLLWTEAERETMLANYPNAVLGHPDCFMERKADGKRVVIECKSTLFFERQGQDGRRRREPDLTPQQQYIIQAAAYGLAAEADEVLIAVSCVQSHLLSPDNNAYRFSPQRYRALVASLVRQYQALTAVGAPMPPASPPDYTRRLRPRPGQAESWMCDYCRLATCEKNNNPERLEVRL